MRLRLSAGGLAAVCALALAACGSSSSSTTQAPSTPTTTPSGPVVGFEGVTIEQGADLGPAWTTTTGATVDGIACGAREELLYHIHAHLLVFVDGSERALPGGIGIPGSVVQQTNEGPVAGGGKCIYWLHTHAPDGIIHIESPLEKVFTLSNFFDVWGQPLSANQVATASGKVTAYVNGKPWTKPLGSIPLLPHAVIQFDVGTPAPTPRAFSWAGTQL